MSAIFARFLVFLPGPAIRPVILAPTLTDMGLLGGSYLHSHGEPSIYHVRIPPIAHLRLCVWTKSIQVVQILVRFQCMATAKSCTVSAALFQGTLQARWYHVCCDDHLVICTCWSFSMNHLPQFLLDQSPIQSVSDLCLFTFRGLYLKQPSASPADTVFPRSLPLSCGLQGQQFLVKMHVSIRGLVNRIRDLHRLRPLGNYRLYLG